MTSQESFACLTTKYEQIAKLETLPFCEGGGRSPRRSKLSLGSEA